MKRFVLMMTFIVFMIDGAILVKYGKYPLAGGFLIILAIGIAIWLKRSSKVQIDADEGWDIGEGWDINNPEKPRKLHVYLMSKALNLGILGVGSPGSGKSMFAIALLKFNRTVRKIGGVYWEGKGDKDIYQQLCASGTKPDKFFSSELPNSDTINVATGETDDVIEALVQSLIDSESPYYKTQQMSALSAVVPLLKSVGKPIVLRDIFVCLSNDSAAQHVMKLAKSANAEQDVIEIARQFFAIDADKRLSDIGGLLSNMATFVLGKTADRLNAYEPTLDLEESSSKGEFVMMHMPYTDKARRISIMLTEQISGIARRRQLYVEEDQRTAWPQLCDDWGKFFYLNSGAITARARSANMQFSYLFQSKGQTDGIDRVFTTEIMDNIGTLVGYRINGQVTAEFVSQEFGTYETTEISSGSYGPTQNTVEKERVRPNDFKNLHAGEAFVSTFVTGEGGYSNNRQYRVRFPMAEMLEDPKKIDWPKIEGIKDNDTCEGLHLWREFMSRDQVEAIKEQVLDNLKTSEATTKDNEVDYL